MHRKSSRPSTDANYKSEAVRQVIERNDVISVARDLGVCSTTRKRWGLFVH